MLCGFTCNVEGIPIKLVQVSFPDIDMAEQELKDFNQGVSLGVDAEQFHKAFSAQNYEETEEEKAETAYKSWMQFKEKSKSIVMVHAK
jgi:hypothetical protein